MSATGSPAADTTVYAIAGDGPLRDPLRAQARDLGVSDLVAFLGRRVGAERDWLLPMRTVFRPDYQASPWAEQLSLAMQDAASRLLLPAIERDVRRALKETENLTA